MLGKILHKRQKKRKISATCGNSTIVFLFLILLFPGLAGCDSIFSKEVEARPKINRERRSPRVEVAIASLDRLREPLAYIGNTQPVRQVSLRSQTEGRLLQLNVDVGDRVQIGQVLAKLDDTILRTNLREAEAELAARKSEVRSALNEVSNAQVRAEQAEVELQQAKADAARNISLAKAGALSRQQAEVAQKDAAVAAKVLRSAREQIRIERETLATARQRVKVQLSAVAEERERLSYANLTSPISGIVFQRLTEPGNLIQPGNELLKLGNFSEVKIVVPVSELGLSRVRVGQTVKVRLDAFPQQKIQGRVSRISPAADITARQIPVEVIIPNPQRRIGSGLLARVEFGDRTPDKIVVPTTALQGKDTVFIVEGDGDSATVKAQTVKLGDRYNDRVEIISGLKPGDRFVARSSRPLTTGQSVRLSALSQF
ncbi:MAG: efflux RND transporter periplasmic adaptor subunit [Prochloraceae cyanobacterium]|nr:efflux RND transporter periplasmic adaptor subunit [Prochloraceae cyanobacterium]